MCYFYFLKIARFYALDIVLNALFRKGTLFTLGIVFLLLFKKFALLC